MTDTGVMSIMLLTAVGFPIVAYYSAKLAAVGFLRGLCKSLEENSVLRTRTKEKDQEWL